LLSCKNPRARLNLSASPVQANKQNLPILGKDNKIFRGYLSRVKCHQGQTLKNPAWQKWYASGRTLIEKFNEQRKGVGIKIISHEGKSCFEY